MPTTISQNLRAAERALEPLGSPRSDAAELLSRLLGIERGLLALRLDEVLTPEAEQRFAQWIARRQAHEPVQYITGLAAFRSLDLQVDRRVLVPRPETEELVEHVLSVLRAKGDAWKPPRVLDLGTGSGCIALAIASEWPGAIVTATDASEEALEVARGNAAAHALASRITFARGEWFDAIGSDERFEVIVSNPPYISQDEADSLPADVREWEPHAALFASDDGLSDLRQLVEEAPRHLVAGGLLALELAEMRAAQVLAWFEGAHDWASAELRDDLSGRPRMLFATREKGPAIAPAQWGEERV